MPDRIEYLTAEDLVLVATIAAKEAAVVRDYGLLDAAAGRPRSSAFGQDAYRTIHKKAAALLQSLARDHALVDGNKRTAWLATVVFYDVNGYDLDAPDDDGPVDLLLDVITVHLDITAIAEQLAEWAKPR